MHATKIIKMAKAGSVESNDILIMMSPGEGSIDMEVESVVFNQYGDDIKKIILDTLNEEGVTDAKVIVKDKGALDFTIKARVKACVRRGSEQDEL
ncbi:citrate lyase acyl carrier protein [Tissierella sp. Yu-01]|uniref:citrate lyase acyl carrier protein n=1 Tax=Tissierella sp. Yu-01 TaxID=3035694 RepID=UPI00240DCAFE|nr:citrate lyase acyl carrier protein [Tissierella sp. Yu-01]WFA09467.1 citrate lyase acyl carrier protein [Tissierella sp. Yu-01]